MSPEIGQTPEGSNIDKRLPPLKASLRRLEEGAREVDELIHLYDEKIALIELQLAEADETAEEAKSRVAAAEAAAADAEHKYKAALALKQGKFEELIAELFEKPSRDLKDSIERSALHSSALTRATTKHSILITVAVAIATLILSSILSSLQGKEIHDRLTQATGRIEMLSTDIPSLGGKVQGVASRLDNLDSKLLKISAAQNRPQGDPLIYYRPRPFFLDVNSCLNRGEGTLKSLGVSNVKRFSETVIGTAGSSGVMVACLSQYKLVVIAAFGGEYQNSFKVVTDLDGLWQKGDW